ncbi:conjugative transposon protein TraJ [Pedobacter sp. UBA4863]|uniref:conjugative transposon protein TraJ n=1 Tax=Pedobacter sp. UBA4863 TaxID=1947060 RepID=UPI0025FD9C00|nr:conjugative transposon protein TraJ [Pedobacter sp. UBA4863]
MKRVVTAIVMMATGMFCPIIVHAQDGIAGSISGLNGVLDQLYDEMIPMCGQLIGVAQGIAGFGALWYIAYRVWRHIANAEPIDLYPLLTPFAMGICIAAFPAVLGIINGVMKPTVTATASMVQGSNKAIETLLKHKEEALKNSKYWKIYVGEDGNGDRDEWYRYTYEENPSDESLLGTPANDLRFALDKMAYRMRNSVKQYLSELLQIIFEAAALCINTLRTFQLVVLAILGPLVFGIAVFDGFQHSLTSWIARYLNVFLWLPVANIFGAIIGKVQEKMITLDIGQIEEQGKTVFSASDTGYLIFMLIGIVGYFTVPSVANFIVNAGFGGAMQQKVTSMFSATTHAAQSAGMATGGRAMETTGNILAAPKHFMDGYSGTPDNSHQGKKISGNT